MLTAGQLCKRKVVTATRADLVRDVVEGIRDEQVGCAIVVDEPSGLPRRPVGVLSERDLAAGALAERRGARQLRVADITMVPMTPVVATDSVAQVLRRMRAASVRHAPVVDDRGIIKGVVAFDEILDFLCGHVPDVGPLLAPRDMRKERGAGEAGRTRPRNEPERG